MINICGFFCVIMSCRDCIHALGSVTRSSQVYQHCPFCCFSRWTFPNRNQGWTTEFEACCIKTVNFTVYTVLLPENGKIHIFNHILHIYRFKFVTKNNKNKKKCLLNGLLRSFHGCGFWVTGCCGAGQGTKPGRQGPPFTNWDNMSKMKNVQNQTKKKVF